VFRTEEFKSILRIFGEEFKKIREICLILLGVANGEPSIYEKFQFFNLKNFVEKCVLEMTEFLIYVE